ncbi:hypothetical protein P22_0267 [Propionispora sp. 2/2-37]|uniref:Rqc2 family fibronectin-binding protein n=1 Tax=Propionispora sp. 2/2-37 TaxID=1677858 RepID=UPI0006BB66EC|nr:NFACT RNA binding domain-containing protein [Propionispora sp. 2/2-37]CUH94201.1 hypothetical protein P22_0267 [Propionispora sp. 2/2-37]
MSLDGFSLSALIVESNKKLAGSRIEKIYQPDKYTLSFVIRNHNENIRLIISSKPENPCLYISSSLPENPASPPAFCMLLRKHLEDGRIAGISQYGLDRIVFIDIDVKSDRGNVVTKRLTMELMGKHSNIILVQDGRIIDSIKRISSAVSRVRQIFPGISYQYPPNTSGYDLLHTPVEDYVKQLAQEEPSSTIAKAIIKTGSGIGPVTAKEIIWRSGLPADITVGSLDQADLGAITEAINSILGVVKNHSFIPTLAFNQNNRITGMASFPLEHLATNQVKVFSCMSELLEFADQLKVIERNPDKNELEKLISNELSRLNRKLQALSSERNDAGQALKYRQYADILMANLYRIDQGSSKTVLTDFYSTVPATITIPLDPSLSASQNAQAYYAKYNKLKRAQTSLTIQITQCRQEIEYLESVQISLHNSTTNAEISEIKEELAQSGYLKIPAKRRIKQAPSTPLTAYSSDGLTILIGKNNRQNDFVTFKQAHTEDIWLHTKNIPGSHVILRTGSTPASPEAINEAAHLAAYFSKARLSSQVPVDFTKRRYVKKPSGSKPGFVIYEHQNTLHITPDEKVVQHLLRQPVARNK